MTSEGNNSKPAELVKFLDLRFQHAQLASNFRTRLDDIINTSTFLLGPSLTEFEEAWASYCDVDYAVGVGNGLDALHLTLRALDIGAGDEVLVPDNTFIATWIAVTLVGAKPIPITHDQATFNIDPDAVQAAIGPKTKAIIAVHLYGQPADLARLGAIAKRQNVTLIEDAAQAHGATFEGRRIGGHSEAAVWSFYPGKNLGALGDAGGITTNNAKIAKRLKALRNYGSSKKYHHETFGVNSRMDDFQAAVLSEKLPHLDEWNARRAQNAEIYSSLLRPLIGSYPRARFRLMSLPTVLEGVRPVWHQYVVRVTHRDQFQTLLLDSGIETSIHYPIPPIQQMNYKDSVEERHLLALDTTIGDDLLSLPIGPHLVSADIVRVCNAIERIVAS